MKKINKDFWRVRMKDDNCEDYVHEDYYLFASTSQEAEEKGIRLMMDDGYENPYCVQTMLMGKISA